MAWTLWAIITFFDGTTTNYAVGETRTLLDCQHEARYARNEATQLFRDAPRDFKIQRVDFVCTLKGTI